MMPMIFMMATLLIKPTKLQLIILFIASITTATSAAIFASAYYNFNAPTVDKNPVVYEFIYPEPYDRTVNFQLKLLV